MIPQEFEYTAPATLQEALALIEGGDAQDPRRRHEPDSADEAAAGRAGRSGRSGARAGTRRDHGERRRGADRRDGDASRGGELAGDSRRSARCSARRRATSATCRCGTWGRWAAASRMPIPRRIIRRRWSRWRRGSGWSRAKSDRMVEASEFFLDAFTTAIEPGEIVLEVQVPVEPSSEGHSYEKVAHPASRIRGGRVSRRGSRSARRQDHDGADRRDGHGAARLSARGRPKQLLESGADVAQAIGDGRAWARRRTRTCTRTASIAGIWRGFTRRARWRRRCRGRREGRRGANV